MDRKAPEKPEFGSPCNGCGYCCVSERCSLAIIAIGEGPGPCPLLEFQDDKFLCGMVLAEEEMEKITGELSPFKLLLGIGAGCDSYQETEKGYTHPNGKVNK